MVRTTIVLTAYAAAALAAFAACSSSSTPGASASSGDAGSNAAVGQPCNPALASPCLPSSNPCTVVTCDGPTKTCVENVSSAPSCQGGEDASSLVNAPCTTALDCDAGQTCGFSLLEGCSATGTCVVPSVPEGGGQALACSCDGVDVPYVGPGLTSLPVASPTACVDAGEDASEDSGVDAGSDAATDASDGG